MFTALFHDSGKPQTSHLDAGTGRVRSPKHAVKGEHLARRVLRELACPLARREEICRLVRFHGRPAFLLEKPNPNHEVVSLSWLVDNRLLVGLIHRGDVIRYIQMRQEIGAGATTG